MSNGDTRLSDSDIPLLTDIVTDAGSDGGDSELLQQAELEVQAEQFEAERIENAAVEVPADILEDIVVLEVDEARAGDTATHYVTSTQILDDPLSGEEYEIVRADFTDAGDYPSRVELEDVETVVAELQTRIASHTCELTDELMRAAFADIEAKVFRQISTNLRQQLPELIDSVVREHLLERSRRSEEGE